MLTCMKWPSYFLAAKVAATLIEVLIFFISFDLLINTAPRFEFDDSPIHAHLGPCKCFLYKQGHLTQKRQKIAVYCNNQCAGLSLFCNIISV